MSKDLTIKELIVLFENELRSKDEVSKELNEKTKEDLILYILEENSLEDGVDTEDSEDGSDLQY